MVRKRIICILMVMMIILLDIRFDVFKNVGIDSEYVKGEELNTYTEQIMLSGQGDIARISDYISLPENTIWSSSNCEVAQVLDGHVIAVTAGSTVLRTNADGVEYSVFVNVKNAYENIKINTSNVILYPGESFDLVVPGVSDEVWKSSDESIVSVDESGTIKAKSIGTANIYAYSSSCVQTAVCEVEVVEKNGEFIENLNDYAYD